MSGDASTASADLLTRLIEAGTPAALVAEVAMLAARAASVVPHDPVAERRREWDREYRAKKRAESKAASGGSGGSRVDNADKVDIDPSPDKSPPYPQKLTPTPCVSGAPTREGRPDVPAIARLEAAQIAIAMVLSGLRFRRWKDMPPPDGVSDEQWRGFLDHRRAKRETLTARAYQLLVKKLALLADDGWPPGEMIDRAVERGWLTVFPPRDERPANGNRSDRAEEFRNPVAAAAARSIARHAGIR